MAKSCRKAFSCWFHTVLCFALVLARGCGCGLGDPGTAETAVLVGCFMEFTGECCWACCRLADECIADEDDEEEILRVGEEKASPLVLIGLVTHGFLWMVIAEVAAEQQWHRLNTFIVVSGSGGEDGPFSVSAKEQRRRAAPAAWCNGGWYFGRW